MATDPSLMRYSYFTPLLSAFLHRHDANFHMKVWTFAPARQVLLAKEQQVPDHKRREFFAWVPAAAALSFVPKMPWPWRSPTLSMSTTTSAENKTFRIGIVGGGIAGVTAAHALAKKLPSDRQYEIVVLEGDPKGGPNQHDASITPQWTAATARNANSLVPAASMHIFSRSSVVWNVMQDTVKEWYYLQKGRLQNLTTPQGKLHKSLVPARTDDFDIVPPYFALHLINCLGPSASSDERWSFVRFLSHFLYSALWQGHAAAHERASKLVQLAKANRAAYLAEASEMGDDFKTDAGHSQGFISLHRTLESAQTAVNEAREFGEEAEIIDGDEAIKLEPHFKNFPMKPLYAVRRPNDFTSSCETFVRQWIKASLDLGVVYKTGNVKRLEAVSVSKEKKDKKRKRFRVATEDGSVHEYDLLVLAAGTQCPLLAAQLGVGQYCPTYPLRGYSMTLFAWQQDPRQKKGNLLHQPFSVDSMYCSSVTPFMARWAGFGEFVGYRDKCEGVPSIAPVVMTRYAKAVFPDAVNANMDTPQPCFRSISPDDLPIVGEVPALPGLFLHTGHGTLGWTTGIATGDCLAQAIVDKLEGRDSQEGAFALPGDIEINRNDLSPKRFE